MSAARVISGRLGRQRLEGNSGAGPVGVADRGDLGLVDQIAGTHAVAASGPSTDSEAARATFAELGIGIEQEAGA